MLHTSHWTELPPATVVHQTSDVEIIDARRCTIQMTNGYLYLDAAASPHHALLGHDRPPQTAQKGARASLDDMSDEFACIAILPDMETAVEAARRMLRDRRLEPEMIDVVDAARGEPPHKPGARIAIENAGLGRTGKWLSSEGWQSRPDLIVLGDALAGGLPFGAILAQRPALDAGPLVACATEFANELPAPVGRMIEAVETRNVLDAVPHLAAYLEDRLRSVWRTCPAIVDIAFEPFRASMTLRGASAAATLKRLLCERGVLVAVDEDDRIVIAPPLVIRPAEIDVVVGALRGALNGVPTWRPAACCQACEASRFGTTGDSGREPFWCS